MEPLKEPISLRTGRINAQILGKLQFSKDQTSLITREGLLDALQVLYEECNTDCLKSYDKNIQTFVERNRKTLSELKQLRVNLADFEVKNVIGRGHFGEVHVVKEKQTGDVYAMKTIRKYKSLEQKNTSFEEERNIMAFANSPWLTVLQYAFQDTSNLYFVMEYHPGGDLLGLLYRQGGTLPESAASFYIAELVIGLNDLHSMGYVHRDIKPDNILLDRCGHLKIADFGSATKLNSKGIMTDVLPVGTPDYIAPEILQSLDNKIKKPTYGTSCDYWSLGILAYELTIGNTPFNGQNTSVTYSKIMNHSNNLKFPPDVVLSQAFVSLIKGLLSDQSVRLNFNGILKHSLFKNVDFNGLRDQVPPYVPKITSVDDTSNFCDIQRKKNEPHIDNFRIKTQFSGKNLPFIGFTYTQNASKDYRDSYLLCGAVKDETVQNLKKEVDTLQRKIIKNENSFQEKGGLEKKLEEKNKKIKSLESLRDHLERDLAKTIAECSALKRTIDLERQDRSDLERKALELIKSTKLKWEAAERIKADVLNKEIEELKGKIVHLQNENLCLSEQLERSMKIGNKHKISLEKVENLSRRSVIGLESRLEKVTAQTQNEIMEMQSKLKNETKEKAELRKKFDDLKQIESRLKSELHTEKGTVADLQTKLENSQKTIKEQDNIISRLEENKNIIEKYKCDIKKLNGKMSALEDGAKQKEMFEGQLMMEKEININFKKEIEDLKTEITFEKLAHQTILDEVTAKFTSEIKELEQKLKCTINRGSELEDKLKETTMNEGSHKEKVRALEDLLAQLESGVSNLESSSERETILQEQISRLEQQLGEVHENLALEKQELAQLKTKFWRMEKDLQNANLDRKIVERDLKETKNQNNDLATQATALNEKASETKKKYEAALLELSGLNENLVNEVTKLKGTVQNLEHKLNYEREKYDEEKNVTLELKNGLSNEKNKITSLIKDLELCKVQKAECERQIFDYERNNSNLVVRLESILKEKADLQNDIENYKREVQNNQMNRSALREACTILENQLEEFEKLYTVSESKRQLLKSEIDELTIGLNQAKQDILDAKKVTNEEISLKLLAETKCKRLGEDVDSLQREIEAHKSQCIEFKQYSNSLSQELNEAEEKIGDLEITLKACGRQLDNFIVENNMLKEENSTHLTHLNNVKESNYKLNQTLKEFQSNNMILLDKVNELENTLAEKMDYYKERELKSEATIHQQTKLIDFLQCKVEESNKKKKTLSDKLFGHSKKENQPPMSVVLNYKDLELQLNKERETSRNLKQEIIKLKSETFSSGDRKTSKAQILNFSEQKKVYEQIVQSPASQKNDLYRQNSIQRMHHNIPHRFETKLCTKMVRCAQCSNQVLLGRNFSVCRECLVAVHPTCIATLPRTCGLPQAYAKHYSESLTKLQSLKTKLDTEDSKEEPIDIEGWVKIPMKGNWEKYYACLTSTTLAIYKEPPNQENMQAIETLELCSLDTHGKVTLEPSSSEVAIPAASSDLPFIIKVEVSPNTTCWPPKCIIFMTLSIEDKDKWFKALEKIFSFNIPKYTGERVMIVDDIDVNCLIELNKDVKLLGTEQGLYSYNDGVLLHITGPLPVYQIALLPTVNIALMIADENRVLISCDLKHLTSLTQCAPCTKPSLKFKTINIKNLNGYHIFQTSDFVNHHMVCVATAKQLVILNYDHNVQEFIAQRILDTAEPTSCILFTEHSLIIGADKFFEIDLGTYDADEFLDASDIKLSHAIKCYKYKSFPLAILQISKSPTEFILCFNEFATFVDEYGRNTRRSDIKWTHLPLAFYYHDQYLYVVQFCAVEVIKINSQMCKSLNDSDSVVNVGTFKIELNSPKYLGSTKRGVYVRCLQEVKLITGCSLDTYDLSVASEGTDQNEDSESHLDTSDRFSFTSSMVHSLDGNLSDNESTSVDLMSTETQKRVKFACRTDL